MATTRVLEKLVSELEEKNERLMAQNAGLKEQCQSLRELSAVVYYDGDGHLTLCCVCSAEGGDLLGRMEKHLVDNERDLPDGATWKLFAEVPVNVAYAFV